MGSSRKGFRVAGNRGNHTTPQFFSSEVVQ